MLYYDKIDISEGIDPAKSIVCHYWFFNHGFEFQDSVCNGCYDLTMLCLIITIMLLLILLLLSLLSILILYYLC